MDNNNIIDGSPALRIRSANKTHSVATITVSDIEMVPVDLEGQLQWQRTMALFFPSLNLYTKVTISK